ncbi:hypothetical protein DXX93_07750 [Thalassotalea euphylliae]|uniref:Rap1a immunity protein domain-containing protein n=1 Tax=Thalassotalea euphylliae TaxID=1655234 RepID=A0A3E0TPI3_9GAMM|nr:hypothetical protein [Thalassotalea euphylliae]REL26486.1 hypothetical protein DXX93_07750 [Thalassotalea euphylliae]
MRFSIAAMSIVLLSLTVPIQASNFSADKMISQCLSDDISPQLEFSCQGFFYGLISKKQSLLSPTEPKGLVERAYNNRTSTSNYSVVKTRKYGMEQVCLPADIEYQTFKGVITQAAKNYGKPLDVRLVTDILARHYSCE